MSDLTPAFSSDPDLFMWKLSNVPLDMHASMRSSNDFYTSSINDLSKIITPSLITIKDLLISH
jgi:hypothetical protein